MDDEELKRKIAVLHEEVTRIAKLGVYTVPSLTVWAWLDWLKGKGERPLWF